MAAVTGIFRDSDENRKARGKARLKFLVDRIGPEALRAEIIERVGRDLRHGVPKAPGLSGEDHVGVLPQSDGVHSTVGLVVPVGRLKAHQLLELARARPQARRPTPTTRCASPTSRTSCCRGSRTRTSTRCSPSR